MASDGFFPFPDGLEVAAAAGITAIVTPAGSLRDNKVIERANELVEARVPGIRPVPFGHLGDGNLHYNVSQPDDMEAEAFLALWEPLNELVHTLAVELGGSFSAEHGIGSLKVAELERLGDPVKLRLMRSVKQALDPGGIMNPGKVLRS